MTPQQAIARTLELDGKATKGPWFVDDHCDLITTSETYYEPAVEAELNKCVISLPYDEDNPNYPLIAEYRTLAPKLAEALGLALEVIHHFSDSADNEIHHGDRRYMEARLKAIQSVFEEEQG